MKIFLFIYVFTIIAVISILGIPGSKSTKPPLQIFPDMEDQPRFRAQGETPFFENRMMDRPVVAGTVSRGREIAHVFNPEYRGRFAFPVEYNEGKDVEGEFVASIPAEITFQAMERGRELYTVFCVQCHGATGAGDGIVTQYGVVGVPNFHTSLMRDKAAGDMFDTIRNGRGIMASYGDKLNPEEAWKVVAYIRALQRAFNASADDVPADQRNSLGL